MISTKFTATRVEGGWAYFDEAGQEVERRWTEGGFNFVSGILGPIEPQGISVSIPGGPEDYPKKYRRPRKT